MGSLGPRGGGGRDEATEQGACVLFSGADKGREVKGQGTTGHPEVRGLWKLPACRADCCPLRTPGARVQVPRPPVTSGHVSPAVPAPETPNPRSGKWGTWRSGGAGWVGVGGIEEDGSSPLLKIWSEKGVSVWF